MRQGWPGPVVVIGAALLLAGATTTSWAVVDRSIGDVVVNESLPGVEVAGYLLTVALVGLAGGVLLLFAPRSLRRVVAAVTAVVGLGAVAGTVVGVLAVSTGTGTVTAAPAVAGAGGVGIVVGAALAVRGPRPELGPRFRLEEPDDPDEWHDTEAEQE